MNLDLVAKIALQAETETSVVRERDQLQELFPAQHQIVGNVRETLLECDRLFDDARYFTRHDDFVSSILPYSQIDPEIQRLRGQIAIHNIKVDGIRVRSIRVSQGRR